MNTIWRTCNKQQNIGRLAWSRACVSLRDKRIRRRRRMHVKMNDEQAACETSNGGGEMVFEENLMDGQKNK